MAQCLESDEECNHVGVLIVAHKKQSIKVLQHVGDHTKPSTLSVVSNVCMIYRALSHNE